MSFGGRLSVVLGLLVVVIGFAVWIAAGSGDALAHRLQALGDRHRIATIAPNLVPSGLRRCDGR